MQSHPPRCLNGFDVLPVEMVGAAFDGHPEALNPTFKIRCKCGHDKGKLTGYFWVNADYDKNKELFISPIEFTCKLCGNAAEIIDTDKHGYDAEGGFGSCCVRGEGRKGEYKCLKCSSVNMEVFVRFEYPEDLFGEYSEDIRGKEQDYFTWFSLHGRCEKCQTKFDITDFECG